MIPISEYLENKIWLLGLLIAFEVMTTPTSS